MIMKLPRVGPTAYAILKSLDDHGPQTATQLLEPLIPKGKSKTWGRSYFSMSTSDNGYRASLIKRGYVHREGNARGGAWYYDLTQYGHEVLKRLQAEQDSRCCREAL